MTTQSPPMGAADAPIGLPPAPLARRMRPRPVRALFVVVGTISVAFGVVGIVVPLLPTTPFLLLASACYAIGSVRFHDWLVGHRVLGAYIRHWQMHRRVPRRAIVSTTILALTSLAISVAVLTASGAAPWAR